MATSLQAHAFLVLPCPSCKSAAQPKERVALSQNSPLIRMANSRLLVSRKVVGYPCGSQKMTGRKSSVTCMVATAGENTAMFAKEMERVAAKEALLLAIKDAGGVEALSRGAGNDALRIDVSEKVLALERLNPTPRPTTGRQPRPESRPHASPLASLDSLTLEIFNGGTKALAALKLLSSVETSFSLTTKLTVEGPLRLKEEYVEGVLAPPSVRDGSMPSQVKALLDQLASATQSLPESLKEPFTGGLKLPLNGTFSRSLLVSYLDDEILIARDQSGVPDILVRVVSSSYQEVGGDVYAYPVESAEYLS
eukprot:jgi/Mesen1/3705/ME000202S02793